MTNLQTLKLKLNLNNASDEQYLVYLVEAGLNPDDEYTLDNQRKLDFAVYNMMIFTQSVKRVSEGGYTIEYSEANFRALFKLFALRYGWEDPFSTLSEVKNATDRW